jgi:hypothetical protein
MGNTVRDEVLSIFSGVVIFVGKIKNGMFEARIYLVAERISGEKVVAATYVKWKFGRYCCY